MIEKHIVKGRGKHFWIGLAVVVVLGFGFELKPLNLRLKQWNVTTNNTQTARALGCVLTLYATDHDGAYPSRLNDLLPDYTSNGEALYYLDLSSDGQSVLKYDWLYFGPGTNEKHPPHIIIASPKPTRIGSPQRIVVYADCSATTPDLLVLAIPENRYQRELHQMIETGQKTPAPTFPVTPVPGSARNP